MDFLLVIGGLWLLYELFIGVPSRMARNRNREPFAWVLISLLGSPILAIFLLWLIGGLEQEKAEAD